MSHDLYLIISGKTFFPNKVTLPSSTGKDLDISLVGPLFTPWQAVRHLSEALSQYIVERGAEPHFDAGRDWGQEEKGIHLQGLC